MSMNPTTPNALNPARQQEKQNQPRGPTGSPKPRCAAPLSTPRSLDSVPHKPLLQRAQRFCKTMALLAALIAPCYLLVRVEQQLHRLEAQLNAIRLAVEPTIPGRNETPHSHDLYDFPRPHPDTGADEREWISL
jgi:hypothetical protein